MEKDHKETPFFTKLFEYATSNTISHDVPGHKLGHIQSDLLDVAGEMLYKLDANAPRGLDNLNRPTGVIMEAAELMADAFGGDKAYFFNRWNDDGYFGDDYVSLSCKRKIILPRNVHKSAINALILSGAVPVFVKPAIDTELGIANHMAYEDVEKAILDNPEAKAVFVINPTYFGVTSDLKAIVELAHERDMMVICDEAHGSHLPVFA